MKFAYADPPYFGMGKKYIDYHDQALIWDDPKAHQELIVKLMDEFPDGWAVSLSEPSLKMYLNFCPDDIRIAIWAKTYHQIRVNVAIQYSWEPIIWRGGRKDTPVKPMVRNWHSGRIAMKKGFYGCKPDDFNDYILNLLQFDPERDELHDLFPGTGGMSEAIKRKANEIPVKENS